MPYKVKLTSRAAKELRRLPSHAQQRVLAALKDLAVNPHPPGSTKLTGLDSHRVRAGDYRVVYDVDDTELSVTVWRVRHRKDVYRDL